MRAIQYCGVAPCKISLSSQQSAPDDVLRKFLDDGMYFNACSLKQLRQIGRLKPNSDVGVRVNPGICSGSVSNKTNVGGPNASFGIWFNYMSEVKAIAKQYNLRIVRIHSHIGSGTDPKKWVKAAQLTLAIVKQFRHVACINIGGGLKIDRRDPNKCANLNVILSSLWAYEMWHLQII